MPSVHGSSEMFASPSSSSLVWGGHAGPSLGPGVAAAPGPGAEEVGGRLLHREVDRAIGRDPGGWGGAGGNQGEGSKVREGGREGGRRILDLKLKKKNHEIALLVSLFLLLLLLSLLFSVFCCCWSIFVAAAVGL